MHAHGAHLPEKVQQNGKLMTLARNIAIASDHAGFALKSRIKDQLISRGLDVMDVGTDSEESVDYPDFGYKAAEAIRNNMAAQAIVVCGSGIGISIAMNREPTVRCALCTTPDMAKLARQHNDANALALGARLTDEATALACVDAFLDTEFEGGRHARRVEKLHSAKGAHAA